MAERVTTLNSVYEIDGNRVRRVSGKNEPTSYQGPDGEWQDAYLIRNHPNGSLVFWWDQSRFTVTSRVIEREWFDAPPEG